jgi:hypothetical protein
VFHELLFALNELGAQGIGGVVGVVEVDLGFGPGLAANMFEPVEVIDFVLLDGVEHGVAWGNPIGILELPADLGPAFGPEVEPLLSAGIVCVMQGLEVIGDTEHDMRASRQFVPVHALPEPGKQPFIESSEHKEK